MTDLTATDLESLISAQTPESRVLEYKRDLPGGRDEDRREFLADVSAMANTGGGTILYGVETRRDESGKDTGIPAALRGVNVPNLDAERLRLQSMLRDGVSPPLTRVALAAVPVPGAAAVGPVLALGVARGITLPHMVAYQRSGKVFRRSETDKYQVDVHELRRMVLESEDWGREADAFRRERVRAVRDRETVPNLSVEGSTFLHVLPLGRLDALHDLRPYERELQALGVAGFGGFSWRWNADGFMLFSERGGADGQAQPLTCHAYVQWFRSGAVEAYADRFHRRPKGDATSLRIDGISLGTFTREYAERAIRFMRDRLAIDPPYAILLSVLGVRGAILSNQDSMSFESDGTFLQDSVLLPAVVIDDVDTSAGAGLSAALAPLLDMFWQSGGHRSAPGR